MYAITLRIRPPWSARDDPPPLVGETEVGPLSHDRAVRGGLPGDLQHLAAVPGDEREHVRRRPGQPPLLVGAAEVVPLVRRGAVRGRAAGDVHALAVEVRD